MLVERGLADAHVGEDRVEPGAAEPVAVEVRLGRLDEAAARRFSRFGGHVSARPVWSVLEVNRKCTTSQLAARGPCWILGIERIWTGKEPRIVQRKLFFIYGAACHALFLLVYAWMAVFVGNLGFGYIPTIDGAPTTSLATAIGIDVLLIAVF